MSKRERSRSQDCSQDIQYNRKEAKKRSHLYGTRETPSGNGEKWQAGRKVTLAKKDIGIEGKVLRRDEYEKRNTKEGRSLGSFQPQFKKKRNMLRLPAKRLWVGEGTPGRYQQDDQTRVTEKKTEKDA